jgi:serine/threonine protein kinase/WD40 repeat protein/tetratricopeptide (TPR) repeat protein
MKESNNSKDLQREIEESWLKKAAAAPEESKRIAEQLNPVPPFAPTLPAESPHAKAPQAAMPYEDRYLLGKEFARGGLGRILSAKDKKLDRIVALKELLSDNDKMRERFLREVLLTARLEHPGIVPIHDIGVRPSGEIYYAMKLVDGRSFDKVIAEKKTLVERLSLLSHVIDACKALAYAHDKGVIHRDLKPHNIMIGSFGETVVIDWGLAKEHFSSQESVASSQGEEGQKEREVERSDRNRRFPVPAGPGLKSGVNGGSEIYPGDNGAYREVGSNELTKVGSILGTPAYMPPEQARGETVDARADVYSLGAILYHLLSGAAPYKNHRAQETIRDVLSGPPVALSTLEPKAPRELLSIVKRAMSRDARDRYPSAAALLDELLLFQQGKIVGAHAYSRRERVVRWLHQNRYTLIIMTLSAIIGFVMKRNYNEMKRVNFYLETANNRAELLTQEAIEKKMLAEESQKDAEKSKQDAQKLLAQLLEEQGIQARKSGLLYQAADSLLHSYQLTEENRPSLRYHLARAQEELPLFSEDGVTEAVLSADGSLLAITKKSGFVELRETKTWSLRSAFFSGEHLTHTSASKDLTKIVTINDNHTVSLWDTTREAKIVTLPRFDAKVSAMISPSGDKLLVNESGQKISLWSPGGEPIYSSDPLVAAEATFAGDHRLVIEHTKGLQVIDTRSSQSVISQSADPKKIAVSREGELLASVTNNIVELWDASTNQKLLRITGKKSVLDLALSSDALVVIYEDNSFETLSTKGELLASSRGKVGSALQRDYLFAISPDGAFLYVFMGSEVQFWGVYNGEHYLTNKGYLADSNASLLISINDYNLNVKSNRLSQDHLGLVRSFTTSASFSSIGTFVDFTDKDAHIKSVAEQKTLVTLKGEEDPFFHFTFSDDGLFLAAIHKSNAVSIWDATTGAKKQTIAVNSVLRQAKSLAGGARLLTHSEDYQLVLWDVASGEKIATLLSEDCTTPIASSDGKQIAAATYQKLYLWDATTGSILLERDEKESFSLAFSPDSKQFLSVGNSGVKLSGLSGMSNKVLSRTPTIIGEFSPDGSLIATAGIGDIRIWNSNTGTLLFELEGHTNFVSHLRFSPDGKLLVSISADGNIKLWDIKNGILLDAWRHQEGSKNSGLYQSFFTKDSQWLVTQKGAGFFGMTRRWSTSLEERAAAQVTAAMQQKLNFKGESGSLDKDIVRRTIRRGINGVRDCYERELASSPALEGGLVSRFLISPRGVVLEASIENSALPKSVNDCVINGLSRMQFPKSSKTTEVIYPFVFQIAGSDSSISTPQFDGPARGEVVYDFAEDVIEGEMIENLLNKDLSANLKRSNEALQLGDLQSASQQYQALLRATQGEESRQIVASMINQYAKHLSPESATSFFQQVNPERVSGWLLMLGSMYNVTGRYQESIEIYESIIQQNPDSDENFMVQYEICMASLSLVSFGEQETILIELEQMVSMYQKMQEKPAPDALLKEARALTAQIIKEIAISWHAEAQRTKAYLRYESAGRLYQRYLALFPEERDTYTMTWNYAELLFTTERYREASEMYQRVAALDPKGKHYQEALNAKAAADKASRQ